MPLWWGSLTGRAGVCIVAGGALAGAALTILAGTGPGAMLGVCLVAGTLAAALAIQPRAVYRIIPAPALAYAVTAPLAGVIGDRGASASHTALAISAAQWIASGFLPMAAATLLAVVVAAIRWLASRPASQHDPEGPVYFPAARPGARSHRTQPVRHPAPPRSPPRQSPPRQSPAPQSPSRRRPPPRGTTPWR